MSANPVSQSQPRQFIEIAKPLIERGIPVIPVQPHEKRCLLPDWPKLATTDIHQIKAWNTENPYFNVGAVYETVIGGLSDQGESVHQSGE